MALITVCTCDYCGPQGGLPSTVELRYRPSCMYDGPLSDALEMGWVVDRVGKMICPVCVEEGYDAG